MASDIFTYMIAGLKFSEMEDPARTLATVGYNMTVAGVKAVELGHRIDPENQIGCVFGLQPVYAYDCRPVSYTHLDVYKRQGTGMPPGRLPAHGPDCRPVLWLSLIHIYR